jgi:hypothetical protein
MGLCDVAAAREVRARTRTCSIQGRRVDGARGVHEAVPNASIRHGGEGIRMHRVHQASSGQAANGRARAGKERGATAGCGVVRLGGLHGVDALHVPVSQAELGRRLQRCTAGGSHDAAMQVRAGYSREGKPPREDGRRTCSGCVSKQRRGDSQRVHGAGVACRRDLYVPWACDGCRTSAVTPGLAMYGSRPLGAAVLTERLATSDGYR